MSSKDAVWPVALPPAAWKRRFRQQLSAWYAEHARDLPWRRSREAYPVWVSEIMLQQTQVATVAGYFPRFMTAFPTVEALAAAPEEQVLRLWEGLGYYRRARQLHAAAKIVVRDHGGRFPDDPDRARQLPGIGRYTAGAILSIAYDASQPILEANTFRLLSRLVAYPDDPQSTAGQRLLWHVAGELLPATGAGSFNQALMELGSTVCTPRQPRCADCPVAALCCTNERGLQESIPPPRARTQFEAVREAVIVIRRRGKILLLRRGDEGRWAGLWDFPRFELAARDVATQRQEMIDKVAAMTGLDIRPVEHLTTIKHGVTRFRITLEAHAADCISGRTRAAGGGDVRWITPVELGDYPLSTTGRKLARLLLAGRPLSVSSGQRRR